MAHHQPPRRPLSHEQQLQMQNELMKQQLIHQNSLRAQFTKLVMGQVMDGIAFTLQSAKSPDPEVAQGAQQDLANLKKLLDQVLSEEWKTAISRISLPG